MQVGEVQPAPRQEAADPPALVFAPREKDGDLTPLPEPQGERSPVFPWPEPSGDSAAQLPPGRLVTARVQKDWGTWQLLEDWVSLLGWEEGDGTWGGKVQAFEAFPGLEDDVAVPTPLLPGAPGEEEGDAQGFGDGGEFGSRAGSEQELTVTEFLGEAFGDPGAFPSGEGGFFSRKDDDLFHERAKPCQFPGVSVGEEAQADLGPTLLEGGQGWEREEKIPQP